MEEAFQPPPITCTQSYVLFSESPTSATDEAAFCRPLPAFLTFDNDILSKFNISVCLRIRLDRVSTTMWAAAITGRAPRLRRSAVGMPGANLSYRIAASHKYTVECINKTPLCAFRDVFSMLKNVNSPHSYLTPNAPTAPTAPIDVWQYLKQPSLTQII